MTPLKRPKYAKIKLSDIPEEVIKEYKSHQYATPDGWVYIKVIRGMYGLPQAIARPRFTRTPIKQKGIFPKPDCARILEHKTKPIQFVLVVDDFGIKYLK
jgi:hypothetical protein